MRPMFHRNRIVLVPVRLTTASAGRPFVASLAGVLLGLLPATAYSEPNLDPRPPQRGNSDKQGALVIVGGGGMPDTIRDRFLDLAGRKNGKLVVIPTASEQADRRHSKSYDYWRRQGLASVSLLHTRNQKEANDPAFVKPLTEATAAWLGGGDQSLLARAYRDTAVERELRRLLKRGGVVGGTSAGASIMSAIMITGGREKARLGTGFGLLPDVVIDQHFENRGRQGRLQGVLQLHPHCLGLGIDEQTAVVVQGDTFTVMGKDNVVLCTPPSGKEAARLTVMKPGEVGSLLLRGHGSLRPLKSPAEPKSVASKESRNAP